MDDRGMGFRGCCDFRCVFTFEGNGAASKAKKKVNFFWHSLIQRKNLIIVVISGRNRNLSWKQNTKEDKWNMKSIYSHNICFTVYRIGKTTFFCFLKMKRTLKRNCYSVNQRSRPHVGRDTTLVSKYYLEIIILNYYLICLLFEMSYLTLIQFLRKCI